MRESGSDGWNPSNDVEFNWIVEPDVTSFSYAFDRSSTTVPDTVSEGAVTFATFADAEDGVWYFHIRGGNAGGWSPEAHYGIRIDATLPEPFEIEILGGRSLTDPTPRGQFSTADLMSGVAFYMLQLSGA